MPALAVVLPPTFYLSRSDLTGRSLRLLTIGLGWSVSTLTPFACCAARSSDERLGAAGVGVGPLVTGQPAAVAGAGLLLLVVTGVRLLAGSEGTVAPVLPFWSARSVANWTVDATGTGDLLTGPAHVVGYAAACLALGTVLTARRLRLARIPEPVDPAPARG